MIFLVLAGTKTKPEQTQEDATDESGGLEQTGFESPHRPRFFTDAVAQLARRSNRALPAQHGHSSASTRDCSPRTEN